MYIRYHNCFEEIKIIKTVLIPLNQFSNVYIKELQNVSISEMNKKILKIN